MRMIIIRKVMLSNLFILAFFMLPANSLFAAELDTTDDSVIPVFNSGGGPLRFVDGAKLASALQGTMTKVNEGTLHTLNTLTASSCENDSPWELRTVSVGLAIDVEAGLGPIISVGAGAKIRLLYTSSDDVVNP